MSTTAEHLIDADPPIFKILVFVPKSEQEEMKLGLAASPFVGFV
jgi:hypothetical protein